MMNLISPFPDHMIASWLKILNTSLQNKILEFSLFLRIRNERIQGMGGVCPIDDKMP